MRAKWYFGSDWPIPSSAGLSSALWDGRKLALGLVSSHWLRAGGQVEAILSRGFGFVESSLDAEVSS